MANRNIPGSGPISGAAKQVVGGNPMGEGALGPLPSLQDSLAKGNITDAKSHIDALEKSLSRYNVEQLKYSKDLGNEQKRQIQSLNEKVKLSQNDVKMAQQQLTYMNKHKDVFKQSIDMVKTRIALEKDNQNVAQKDIRRAQEIVRLEGVKANQQRSTFTQFREQSRQTASELNRIEQARQRSFGSHLVSHNFNPIRAAQSYGQQKMEMNKPAFLGGDGGSSMSEFAGGAVAAAGGAVLSKLIGIATDAISRNLQVSYTLGDVYKGSGSNTSLRDFKGSIHEVMNGYGTSSEEEAALAKGIRPTVGGVGNYEEIMRQGVSQDRAFGSELGTGSMFMANMIRKSDSGSDDASLNKLSAVFAEAIGRGRMVGLQEELVGGVTQLVEITRRSSTSGAPSANMFAGMIADISSIGNKNLRGADAANVIAGFDSGLKNPSNAFASVIGPMAIRTVLSNLASEGKVDKSLLNQNSTILGLQAQGMAAQVMGKDGKMIPLGSMLMPQMLKQAVSMGGGHDDMTALAMSNSFNIPFGQMSTMLKNDEFLGSNPGAKFSQSFGLDKGLDHFNTGTSSFIRELSSIFTTQTQGGKTDIKSEVAKNAYVNEALARFKETLSDEDQNKMKTNLEPNLIGKSANDKVQEILKFAQNIKEGAPTDQLKADIENIRKATQKMADAVVDKIAPSVARILNFLVPGPRDEATINAATAKAKQEGVIPGGHSAKPLTPHELKMQELRDKAKADGIIPGRPSDSYYKKNGLPQGVKEDISANKQYLEEAANKAGIDPKLASFIAGQESGYTNFDKNGNVLTNKDSGAMGIMQLMPDTAKLYGVNPNDTHQVIDAGVKELKKDLDKHGGKVDQALIDYDGGGVHLKNGTPLKPETIQYLLSAQRAGVLPPDYRIPEAYTGGDVPDTPPQTRGQQSDNTPRVGVDQNVTLTVQNPSGQMTSQDSSSYSHQITSGQTAPTTAYKKTINTGPSLP